MPAGKSHKIFSGRKAMKIMKKKIIGVIASALLLTASAAHVQVTPKIIVDDRELFFEDQGPVIVEETNRTLIPLRFVCNMAGANVDWDGEKQQVTVTSNDNRNMAIVTIGSDDMTLYYFPSVLQVVSDVQKLDQVPVIMNDRTMIPVRAVLEAIGAKVDWDTDTQTINITSRDYARYLRDMGVDGYEVNYPLANGAVSFDTAPEGTSEKTFNKDTDLPKLSLSPENTSAAKGDTVDIYLDFDNVEKFSEEPTYLSTMSLGLIYDHTKLKYKGYKYVNGDTEYSAVLDASNETFREDCLKISSVASLITEERTPLSNGHIAKLSFELLTDDPAEVSISTSIHSRIGKDTDLGLDFGDAVKIITISEADELYIDTTPVTIGK